MGVYGHLNALKILMVHLRIINVKLKELHVNEMIHVAESCITDTRVTGRIVIIAQLSQST